MTKAPPTDAKQFRELHARGGMLLLPNAWDAASARLFEAAGARAIATTSAGLAWAAGWPDGDALPPRALAAAVAALADAGAVGINLEDGSGPPERLCAKIEAVKSALERAGVDLFVNARTDVYLRGLVPPDRALAETLERGRRYRDAGADGYFVPRLTEPDAIRTVAAEIDLPLNLLVVPGLASPSELQKLGVRRVSAGSALAASAYGFARRAAVSFLDEGRYDAMSETTVAYAEMNGLLASARAGS